MLLGQVLRAQPPHGGRERVGVAGRGRARSDRPRARAPATPRWQRGQHRDRERRPRRAAARGSPATSAHALPARAAGPRALSTRLASEEAEPSVRIASLRNPLPDVVVHVVRQLVGEDHLDLVVRVRRRAACRTRGSAGSRRARPAPRWPCASGRSSCHSYDADDRRARRAPPARPAASRSACPVERAGPEEERQQQDRPQPSSASRRRREKATAAAIHHHAGQRPQRRVDERRPRPAQREAEERRP